MALAAMLLVGTPAYALDGISPPQLGAPKVQPELTMQQPLPRDGNAEGETRSTPYMRVGSTEEVSEMRAQAAKLPPLNVPPGSDLERMLESGDFGSETDPRAHN